MSIYEPLPSGSDVEVVRAYHARTKHQLQRFAAGPTSLDWDAPPAPFRNYPGAEVVPLPLLFDLDPEDATTAAFRAPFRLPPAGGMESVAWTLASLGVLLHASLGITAWKSLGPDRWAVRANPSSGNLHPVEAYVISRGVPFLGHGVFHYCPREHVLERRVAWPEPDPGECGLFIALSTVMWRETWKYGERAFRYCQLDTGHAVGALCIAAALLGAEIVRDESLDAQALSGLLGLARAPDAECTTEREEPELALRIELPPRATAASLAQVVRSIGDGVFAGKPSIIDPRPVFRWPIVEQVARCTRPPASSGLERRPVAESSAPDGLCDGRVADGPSAAAVLMGRRSAQRFDAEHVMQRVAFERLLRAAQFTGAPFGQVFGHGIALDLLLFVHRVEGLEPGLYLLPRPGAVGSGLTASLDSRFLAKPAAGASDLPLVQLCRVPPRELMRIARAIHCHQDIASRSCFALGMIAEVGPALASRPWDYRELHRAAGVLGHRLYLAAEAVGLRGTGIGCFFDDAVHELLGLEGEQYQSIYHFTVGRPIDDPRIENGPAYPGREHTWQGPKPPQT